MFFLKLFRVEKEKIRKSLDFATCSGYDASRTFHHWSRRGMHGVPLNYAPITPILGQRSDPYLSAIVAAAAIFHFKTLGPLSYFQTVNSP
jgi:hypothetical protein